MKSKIIKSLLIALALSGSSVIAIAAEPGQASKPMTPGSDMTKMPMQHGMMGNMTDKGGMGGGGMMEMMQSCQKMMDSTSKSAGPTSPRLPPGNEKLEFQMHAEMMQKMGEIATKYAEKIR